MWVTVRGYTIFIFNQPPRPTQPGHPSVSRCSEGKHRGKLSLFKKSHQFCAIEWNQSRQWPTDSVMACCSQLIRVLSNVAISSVLLCYGHSCECNSAQFIDSFMIVWLKDIGSRRSRGFRYLWSEYQQFSGVGGIRFVFFGTANCSI